MTGTRFTVSRAESAAGELLLVEADGVAYGIVDLLGRDVGIREVVDGDAVIDEIARALGGERPAPVDTAALRLLPPTVERPAVFCAGANFGDHVAEMGEEPLVRAYHFLSPPTVLGADGDEIRRPSGAEKLDWEVELVAVIGRSTFGVDADRALDSVLGYTVGNDVSVRGAHLIHPIFGMDWGAMKNGDGLSPIGPALVPARFIDDPQHLAMRLTVDGVIRQESSTDQMLVSVAEQIAAISRYTTLRPGDLIFTGTPAGTARAHNDAYLADGATLVAEIEGVGILTNSIVASDHKLEKGNRP